MPILASGNSTSLTLGTYDSITLQNRAGQSASLTIAGVLVNGAHSGTRTYGPYPAGGAVSITATAGDVYYEAADGRGFTKPVEYTEEGPSLSGEAAGAVMDFALPTSLRVCIPGRDPSTNFGDISGNVGNLAPDTANTAAFASPDYFASIAGTRAGLTIPAGKVKWMPSSQSVILAFVLKRAAPGSNQNLMAWGGAVAAGNVGFYLSHRTSGALKVVPIINGAIVNAQADSTLSFSDGTPQDRHVLIAYDAPSGSWYIYRDGVLSNAFPNQMVGATAYPAATPILSGISWGGSGEATATTVAALGRGLQAYVIDGPLPLNVGLLAAKLAAVPGVPLSGLDVA